MATMTRSRGVGLGFRCLGLGLLLLLLGCGSYIDGHSRTYGELADDAGIQTRVKATLISATEINGLLIDVDVRKGVVWLTGNVADEAARAEALSRARGVKGVVSVIDRLKIVTK